MKTALQTPLLQDLLSDTTCVRQLLLSNSTISQLIVNNPGLKDFIDRDDKLRELTEAISDTTQLLRFQAPPADHHSKGGARDWEPAALWQLHCSDVCCR